MAFGSGDGWFAARAAAAYATLDLGLAFEAASSLEALGYVLMIAEKACDLILGRPPLAPETFEVSDTPIRNHTPWGPTVGADRAAYRVPS